MKNKMGVIVLQLAGLAWFGLSAKAHAVVTPPDGSYPGFNTAEGQNALFNLTTGSLNTAVSKALPLQRLCCVPRPRMLSGLRCSLDCARNDRNYVAVRVP